MASPSWNTGPKAGLVSIGTHSLHLQASGPDRIPGEPAVLIIQGVGSCVSSWAAVVRLLNSFIRVYAYDRSGLGKSEPSTLPPTSTNIVKELNLLLKATDIAPPYILIAHSWGGILSREFIGDDGVGDIAGIVFVEANQERTLEILDWRPIFNWVLENEIDIQQVLDLKARQRLTAEEWSQYLEDDARSYQNGQVAAEQAQYEGSFAQLAFRNQLHQCPPFLESKPLSVLKGDNGRDLQKLHDAVVEERGVSEQADKFQEFLRTFDRVDSQLQSELQNLSSKSRMIQVEGGGHEVQLTAPEKVVEMVRWVVACRRDGSSCDLN